MQSEVGDLCCVHHHDDIHKSFYADIIIYVVLQAHETLDNYMNFRSLQVKQSSCSYRTLKKWENNTRPVNSLCAGLSPEGRITHAVLVMIE